MHGDFPTSAEDVLQLVHEAEPWLHDGHGDDGSLLDPVFVYTFDDESRCMLWIET